MPRFDPATQRMIPQGGAFEALARFCATYPELRITCQAFDVLKWRVSILDSAGIELLVRESDYLSYALYDAINDMP